MIGYQLQDLSAANIAQPIANPLTTTTYTLTVTGSNGCTATSTVVITVDKNPPVADAGMDKDLDCSNKSAVLGTPAIAGNTYSWLPVNNLNAVNIAQPTANPSTMSIYTVTVTGANGCTATDVVIVNVNIVPPTVDAGPDQFLDCNTTSTMIGSIALPTYTYSWSPSTDLSATNIAQPIASPLVTTTYTVSVTGANGCNETDVVIVNVNTTPPTVDAGLDQNVDCSITTANDRNTGCCG